MVNYIATDTELTAVADAVRSRAQIPDYLSWPNGYVQAIMGISSGDGELPFGLYFDEDGDLCQKDDYDY